MAKPPLDEEGQTTKWTLETSMIKSGSKIMMNGIKNVIATNLI